MQGCALGLGAVPNVGGPLGADYATETRIARTEFGYAYLETYRGKSLGDGPNLPFGVSGGVMPSVMVLFPAGNPSAPTATSTGLGLTAHGDLYVPMPFNINGTGLGLTVQYQYGYVDAAYLGGYVVGARQHGVMGFLGTGFGPVGFELGAGGLFAGQAGVGVGGNFLDDSAFSLGSADTAGVRTALRTTLFFSGGGVLQLKSAVRVELGYQALFAAQRVQGVPMTLGAFNAGFEFLFSIF